MDLEQTAVVQTELECLFYSVCRCMARRPGDGLSQTDYLHSGYGAGDKLKGGWMEVRRTGWGASLDWQAPPGGRPLPRTNENPL